MTALAAKNVLDGTKAPATTTSEMKIALGSLRDFLSESLGTEGTTAFSRSLAASGYQKLPSGLILQWGTAVTPSNGTTTVGFNIAFPTAALIAMGNIPSSGFSTFSVNISAITTTQMNVRTTNNNAATEAGFYWFAIGY